MKRLDQLKDDLEEFDREATGDSSLRVEWDFDRHARFTGSFYSGTDSGRPPRIELNYPTIERWFRTLPTARAGRRLRGLNFHELGHALFTPRSEPRDTDLEHFSNILEDQRVERLIIHRYPDSERCLQELLSNPEVLGASLTVGRPHVTADERRFYEGRFATTYGRSALHSLREIIGAYVALDSSTPKELTAHAARLQSLMVELGAHVPRDYPFDIQFDSH